MLNTDVGSADERSAQALGRASRLRELGKGGEARKIAERVLRITPNNADALELLGWIEFDSRNGNRASACFQRLITQHPSLASGYAGLARVQAALGNHSAAIENYRRALELAPESSEIAAALGTALLRKQRLREAEEVLRRACSSQPDRVDTWIDFALALGGQKKLRQAEAALKQALELDAHHARANQEYACLVRDIGRVEEAMRHFRLAIAANPKNPAPHAALAAVLDRVAKHDEAIDSYRRAVALAPGRADLYSSLLFGLTHHPHLSPNEVFQEHLRFGELFGNKAVGRQHSNLRDPARKLRVGYVSGDFCNHAVLGFVEPVLIEHDPEVVDVFCYSNVARPDQGTARVKSFVPNWHSIFRMSDQTVAKLIESHQIDVLIDVSGHTMLNRLPVFVLRPAPVQVTWLGYPNTTGLKEIDYRIVAIHAPANLERLSSERLYRMPAGSACYQPPAETPEPSEAPCARNGFITFGSFNAPRKLNAGVLQLWAAILRAVPSARLLFKSRGMDDAVVQDPIKATLAQEGIAAERLLFHAASPRMAYYQAFQEIDIALDPFPYTGGTTTRDTLWMGVPVVTLDGDSQPHSVSAGILKEAGLREWVASTPNDYCNIAVSLAADHERLASIRVNLRRRLLELTSFQPRTYTRQLENAYREMWKEWCRSEHEQNENLRLR